MKGKDAHIPMYLGTVMNTQDCARKRAYAGLGIMEPHERSDFLQSLLCLQGQSFGQPEAPDIVNDYIQQKFQKQWTLCGIQYEIQREEMAAYHKRMASFFIGKKLIASNLSWTLSISPLPFGDSQADAVFGYVHAVTEEPDGSYCAYVLKGGKPVYSAKARKKENLPENAPELIGAYLALSKQYPGLTMNLVYLKRKADDPSTSFSPSQVLAVDFAKVPKEELYQRFLQIVSRENGTPECDTCQYRTLCGGIDIPLGNVPKKPSAAAAPPVFTETQNEIIGFRDGACAVYAVPGAGKTTTLVHRMVRLMNEGVSPKEILFVTFTGKAADEIRTRARAILGDDSASVPDVYTYNGLGWHIIRDHPELAGELKLITIMDEKRLLLQVIDAYGKPLIGFSYNQIEGKFGLINTLLRIFRALEDDEAKASAELLSKGRNPVQVKALWEAYRAKAKAERYITYDDQILIACEMLRNNPQLLSSYARRWKYIMADEYQDSSQQNVELLYMLAKAGRKNIVVVGDADQSIFEWRDGSPKYLLGFRDEFPDAKILVMSDNFRSSRGILDASNALISNNKQRAEVNIISHLEKGGTPSRIRNFSLERIPELLAMLRKNHYEYGDVAILARTNAPLAKLKKILENAGIASVSPSDYLLGDSSFVILKAILDMYFLGFEQTDAAFYSYLSSQGVKIPPKTDRTMTLYHNLIKYHHLTPVETGRRDAMFAYLADWPKESKSLPLALKKLFRLFLALDEGLPAEVFVQKAAREFQIPEDYPGIRAILQCMDYEAIKEAKDLQQYFSWMVTMGDETKIEYDVCPDKVNLLTAHGSKGKEFPVVIIIQSEDFKANEQERRLLYVAMTRAKKALFLLESPYSTCEMADELGDTVSAVAI